MFTFERISDGTFTVVSCYSVPPRARAHTTDLFSSFVESVSSLLLATSFASWEVVEALLEMGADPLTQSANEHFNSMHGASIIGRPLTITNWAARFPQWDWEARGLAVGVTAMMTCVFVGPDKIPTMQALIDVGADPLYRTYNGAHILISIAASQDSDADMTRFALSIPGMRQLVNGADASNDQKVGDSIQAASSRQLARQ